MNEDLSADDLIRAWKFQDQFGEMALNLLRAGVELGARSTVVEIARHYIDNNYEYLETEDFEEARKRATERAIATLEQRIKDARESGTAAE